MRTRADADSARSEAAVSIDDAIDDAIEGASDGSAGSGDRAAATAAEAALEHAPDGGAWDGLPPRELAFVILVMVFVACMSFINVVSAKLWTVAGLTISGGIMAYWLTFPITDAIGEVFGRRRAQLVVWLGFAANLLVLGMSQIAVRLPPAPRYPDQAAFADVLGAVPLVVAASLTAYLAAQSHDVWAFERWRRVTGGRHLWLRNNLSTASSQLIDSLVFNGIAFWLFAENRMPPSEFLSMTVGYWSFKVAIAIIDTPIVYALVHWLRAAPAERAAAPDPGDSV